MVMPRNVDVQGVGSDGNFGHGPTSRAGRIAIGMNASVFRYLVDGKNKRKSTCNPLIFPRLAVYVRSLFGTLDEVTAGLAKIMGNRAPPAAFNRA